MSKYSEQDLKYAAEFREEIHKEALAIVRKTSPNVTEVIDRHPVEDYFQENWEYPGKWYTIVSIPYVYNSRKALVDTLVRDTLSGKVSKSDDDSDKAVKTEQNIQGSIKRNDEKNDAFYQLLEEYPDIVVDYRIVNDVQYSGYASHHEALKSAYDTFGEEWEGNPDKAAGKATPAEEIFSSNYREGKLNYRKAFLYPPHKTSYNGKDFARVNTALFPNGTAELEVYEWDTDWSDYFDDGREWWGTLCLTVYDKTLNRFVVITASATD